MEQSPIREPQDTAEPGRGEKVRFFLDPQKSDQELADLIMEMAEEHFDLAEGE